MSSDHQPPVAGVRLLRDLARCGRLATAVRTATPAEYAALSAAAYEISWPVVFHRITRPVERRRGHWRCSTALVRLSDQCIDRFHDDVEAVVTDLLRNARAPVADVEAWLCGRLTAATVDGHRRRRGMRGALQRPRMPGWLAAELGHDPWLVELAVRMLDWVGVPESAGSDLWPLDRWTLRRAEVTGDWAVTDRRTVLAEVGRVSAAMRRRPNWYADYVERPLGAKVAPVSAPAIGGAGDGRPLVAMTPEDGDDDRLAGLAFAAVDAIAARLRRGADPREAVERVLRAVFGAGTGSSELARAPGTVSDLDEQVSRLLADRAAFDQIVARVMEIVACGE